ncbi:MAG: ribosome assembly cofactor RimP [Flavobacteriales bacterium]|jgi:ribosome maturation factor RimP|nr:ribosome assembly cofactor RimP [Flavobacteriales bacterium]
MITQAQIKKLVTDKIEDTDQFMVSVEVKPGNNIQVEVDSMSGIGVQEFMAISRHIEGSLDREIEDFSLRVSSPGVGEAYKVLDQYKKNVGRKVKVKTNDDRELVGELISFDDEQICVKTKERKKVEGKKSKQVVEEDITIRLQNIKETNTEISFK